MKSIILGVLILTSLNAFADPPTSAEQKFLIDLKLVAHKENKPDKLMEIDFARKISDFSLRTNEDEDQQDPSLCFSHYETYRIAHEVQSELIDVVKGLESIESTNTKLHNQKVRGTRLYVKADTIKEREVNSFLSCMAKWQDEINLQKNSQIVNESGIKLDALEEKLTEIE